MLQRTLKTTLALSTALWLASCEKDSSANNAGNNDDGNGGGGTNDPSELITLSGLNFESEAKFVGPRVHTIVSEVYRNLELIHAVVDIDTQMTAASAIPRDDTIFIELDDVPNPDLYGGTAPIDLIFSPLASGAVTEADETCSNNAGISTVFSDVDGILNPAQRGLTPGDEILRDYDNVSCSYDFFDNAADPATVFEDTTDPKERRIPTTITGSIRYTFTSSAADMPRFTGTATLGDPDFTSGLNYEVTDGLLEVADTGDSDQFNGTVDFDIDFATGNATFTNINVRITGSSSSLTGPNIITIDTVDRQLEPTLPLTGDVLEIRNGVITSELSTLGMQFETVAYNGNGADLMQAPDGGLPNLGAILFTGGGSTAARARTDASGGIPVVDLEETFDPAEEIDNVAFPTTINQFDDDEQAEPGGSAWFVSGFLLAPE